MTNETTTTDHPQTAAEAILVAKSMDEAVHLAVGAASVCWESMEGTGVFQDDRAREIAEALLERIKDLAYEAYMAACETYMSVDEAARKAYAK